ncbi:MAG: M43 family zinc metalloprotease, partial [Bacteroidota bacterium]
KSCIKFKIADINHPQGYELSDSMKAITINQLVDSDWNADWANYLNIFVKQVDDNNTILGYSPLGGFGRGDGVVISKFAFGGTGWCGDISQNNNFDKGRTLTHELGHYFALEHIWGNQQNCEEDDGHADTPNQSTPNFGCTRERMSCSSIDLSMNYMDYVDDGCMYLFTNSQSKRMDAYVQTFLPHLVRNAYEVVSELKSEPLPEEILEEPPVDTIPDTTTDTTETEEPDTNPTTPTTDNLNGWSGIELLVFFALFGAFMLFRGRQQRLFTLLLIVALTGCEKEDLRISQPVIVGEWRINTDVPFFHVGRMDITESEITFYYDLNDDGIYEDIITNRYQSVQDGEHATLLVRFNREYRPWANYYLHSNHRYLHIVTERFGTIYFERLQ